MSAFEFFKWLHFNIFLIGKINLQATQLRLKSKGGSLDIPVESLLVALQHKNEDTLQSGW